MNRKGFLKTLGALFTLPFVTPAMAAEKQWMEKMPKPVQKQTKVEQDTLKKFYREPDGATGFMYSGVYSVTGSYNPRFMVSGIVAPEIADKLRKDGVW